MVRSCNARSALVTFMGSVDRSTVPSALYLRVAVSLSLSALEARLPAPLYLKAEALPIESVAVSGR